jgi:hypothetical protein
MDNLFVSKDRTNVNFVVSARISSVSVLSDSLSFKPDTSFKSLESSFHFFRLPTADPYKSSNFAFIRQNSENFKNLITDVLFRMIIKMLLDNCQKHKEEFRNILPSVKS